MKTLSAQAAVNSSGISTISSPVAELILCFNFSSIPTTYCGVVIARLGELYKHTTGDDLYMMAVEMGSLKLRFRALKRHLKPFSCLLAVIFNPQCTSDDVERTLDENIGATPRDEISGLTAEVTRNAAETKLKAVMELPAFVRQFTQYRKDFDATVTPEELMRTGSAAAAFYAAVLDLGETRLLHESLGLNVSIQDLKDNITIQLIDPTDE